MTMLAQFSGEATSVSAEERYMLLYVAAGTAKPLKAWLSGGCKESPEQILHIIKRNLPDAPRPPVL